MTTGLWLALALPVMAAMLFFYFTISEKNPRLIAKGGATWIALMTAVHHHAAQGGLPSGGIIIAAVALFVLADVLLNLKFVAGVAAFGLGHIALLIWLGAQEAALHRAVFSLPGVGIALLLYGAAVFLFRRSIRESGKLAAALLPYAAILSLMAGVSATLPFLGGMQYLPFAAGAILFMGSDLLVAKGVLVGMARRGHILTMILYESAVLLMALCA